MKTKPDRLAVMRDQFVMDLLRQAREFGAMEERKRVVDWLYLYGLQTSAKTIEAGIHDGGRTFTAYRWTWPEDEDLPVGGDASTPNVNPSASTPQETPCQSHSKPERKAHRG